MTYSTKYPRSRVRALLGSALLALFLSGCLGGPREVREADKDSAGQYNGEWIATVAEAASRQRVQNWQITCPDRSGQYLFAVKDGEISTTVNWTTGAKTYTSFINKNGRFVLSFPSGISLSSSSASDVHLAKEEMDVIFRGDLAGEKLKGSLVVGLPTWGGAGCTYSAAYAKR